ncbi:LysR substrate-binding domain-containing protein [Pseudomonas matsuisoli]|uniref:LysR family transcriptional regulator n=1 Tax=Pseudomonas matsuisoli TaxID=1515666 RepID=A0A917PIY9_9PSED|nr:LysR substrate-binding domain-containing protein [Pseudomonas matsuisoli]GGJ79727.1 LysR family transcriptional regulator [Pseudomonas matsuisoli]
MNFKQVEAFRAVMLSGSMTAAAEAMHTSQPNISRLIAQLERASGFRLFERFAGRLMPTEEGKALFRDVERAFVGLKSLEESVQRIRQVGTGRLRIGAVPSMSLTILPRVVQRFRQLYPKVAVSVHTSDSATVAHWAASQFCDFGLVTYVGDETPGIVPELICDVPGVCILPPEHHLSAASVIRVEDLAGEEFISLLHSDGTRLRIDHFFQSVGVKRLLSLETHFAATICMMVGMGMGVSLVSPWVASEYRHTGIQVRPFSPDFRFSSYLLHPAHTAESTLSQRFTTVLESMMRDAVEGR